MHELGNERAIGSFIPFLKLVKRIKPDIIFATLGFVISAGLMKPFISKNTKIIIRLGNTISAHLNEIKPHQVKLNILLLYIELFSIDKRFCNCSK